MTGELIRLTQHVDPDTGGLGRDAVIAAVTYNHADQSATVELDNTRGSLDALLSRLAAIQSVGA